MKIRAIILSAIWVVLITSCDFGIVRRNSVTINLNPLSSTFYFDGGCIPRFLSMHGSLEGDFSRVTTFRYSIQVFSDASRLSLLEEFSATSNVSPDGRFRGGFNLAGMIPVSSSQDEYYGIVILSFLDGDEQILAERRHSFIVIRCQLGMTILNEMVEISTREVYGPGCSPSSTRFTLRLSGAIASIDHAEVDWSVHDPLDGSEIFFFRRPMHRADLSGDPGMIPMIEFSDEFYTGRDMASFFDVEIPPEPPIPVPLSADPLALIKVFAFVYDRDSTSISLTQTHEIPVHPCNIEMLVIEPTPTLEPKPTATPAFAKDCPPGTYFVEVTHRCIPIDTPIPGTSGGDSGGSSGGSSCYWDCTAGCVLVCP
jgi:hypothetical protein